MLYFIEKNANDITDEICIVYGSGIASIRNWFKRFRVGNFDLKDEGRSDCLATILSRPFSLIIRDSSAREIADECH